MCLQAKQQGEVVEAEGAVQRRSQSKATPLSIPDRTLDVDFGNQRQSGLARQARNKAASGETRTSGVPLAATRIRAKRRPLGAVPGRLAGRRRLTLAQQGEIPN